MRELRSVRIAGIVSCAPSRRELNSSYEDVETKKLIASIGVIERRVSDGELTSDLGLCAARRLLSKLATNVVDIDALIFVTQTPDYQIPSTGPLIATALGLRNEINTFDINQGCSGFVSALQLGATLISSGYGKILVIVGDTATRFLSPQDKSSKLLFGDGAASILIEANRDPSQGSVFFDSWVDGSGSSDIMIKNYGTSGRNPFSSNINSENFLSLNGANVFSFAISRVPKFVSQFLSSVSGEVDDHTIFAFHQANRMINAMIEKKLSLKTERVMNSIEKFGNTSSASIPLSLTHNRDRVVAARNLCIVGFGVGLSINVGLIPCSDMYLEHLDYGGK